MREVCFLIGPDDTIVWSDASDSPSRLPDSRARWDAIWSRREALVEIAHSHPRGLAEFSAEDETTMQAIIDGLGRAPRFSVVAPRAMVRRVDGETHVVTEEPWWAALMRLASGMTPTEEK